MQKRCVSGVSHGGVRPSCILTEERYQECGSKELAAALDQAVSELVERHQLVEAAFAADLRQWLYDCVISYFAGQGQGGCAGNSKAGPGGLSEDRGSLSARGRFSWPRPGRASAPVSGNKKPR
jgi:hypothetical protein